MWVKACQWKQNTAQLVHGHVPSGPCALTGLLTAFGGSVSMVSPPSSDGSGEGTQALPSKSLSHGAESHPSLLPETSSVRGKPALCHLSPQDCEKGQCITFLGFSSVVLRNACSPHYPAKMLENN